jgi:hypothetical protein
LAGDQKRIRTQQSVPPAQQMAGPVSTRRIEDVLAQKTPTNTNRTRLIDRSEKSSLQIQQFGFLLSMQVIAI